MRDSNAAEPQPAVSKLRDTVKQAAAKTERHDPRMPRKGRFRPGLFILHMVQRSHRARGPGAPHSRKAAAAAERHDLTLMQPLFSEPAFDEYSVTLAVLDFHCATNVYPELCTLGFMQPSGLLKESWSSPRLLLLKVQRSWPRSRNQMLRIRGKQPQLRNDMTSHLCSR